MEKCIDFSNLLLKEPFEESGLGCSAQATRETVNSRERKDSDDDESGKKNTESRFSGSDGNDSCVVTGVSETREARNLAEEAYIKETEALEEFQGHDSKWFVNGTGAGDETTADLMVKLNVLDEDGENKSKVNILMN